MAHFMRNMRDRATPGTNPALAEDKTSTPDERNRRAIPAWCENLEKQRTELSSEGQSPKEYGCWRFLVMQA
jgi:hypothetical protein